MAGAPLFFDYLGLRIGVRFESRSPGGSCRWYRARVYRRGDLVHTTRGANDFRTARSWARRWVRRYGHGP